MPEARGGRVGLAGQQADDVGDLLRADVAGRSSTGPRVSSRDRSRMVDSMPTWLAPPSSTAPSSGFVAELVAHVLPAMKVELTVPNLLADGAATPPLPPLKALNSAMATGCRGRRRPTVFTWPQGGVGNVGVAFQDQRQRAGPGSTTSWRAAGGCRWTSSPGRRRAPDLDDHRMVVGDGPWRKADAGFSPGPRRRRPGRRLFRSEKRPGRRMRGSRRPGHFPEERGFPAECFMAVLLGRRYSASAYLAEVWSSTSCGTRGAGAFLFHGWVSTGHRTGASGHSRRMETMIETNTKGLVSTDSCTFARHGHAKMVSLLILDQFCEAQRLTQAGMFMGRRKRSSRSSPKTFVLTW